MSVGVTSDDDDWFNKDEDEIVQGIKQKVAIDENKECEHVTEYIRGPSSTDEYLQNRRLKAASALTAANVKSTKTAAKLSTAEMRKIGQMKPLDAFLYAWTWEPNFFVDQISINDAQERVLLYMHILLIICELKLPVFDKELMQHFVANEALLEQLNMVTTKLFLKRYRSMWTQDERADEVVHAIATLLLRAHSFQLLTPKVNELMRHIKKLLESKDASEVAQHVVCKEFAEHLDYMLAVDDTKEHERTSINVEQTYPTLAELLVEDGAEAEEMLNRSTESDAESNIAADKVPRVNIDGNVLKYIELERRMLREDFLKSLRECVHVLKKTKSFSSIIQPLVLYEDVHIVLNTDFGNASRHEMIFVDVLGSRRTDENCHLTPNHVTRKNLSNLKNGSLLCLTTNTDFENLILATVTYTDGKLLRQGYVGVEIVRQYNIGNVYDKSLLMFETPAFFEPYHNVYNYLSSCEAAALPMERYLVYGATNVHPPRYLKPNTIYKYDCQSFNPLKAQSVSKQLPLNKSQVAAYFQALSQELCLIQGPPGTGKTHLSVHLVRTLMENTDTPIVLITYTNESLDKFLLKLCAYTKNILRFGGQIRQEEIAKFNVNRDAVSKNMVNPQLKRLYYVISEEYKAKFAQLQKWHEEFDGSEESYQKILFAQNEVRYMTNKLSCIRVMFQYYGARQASIIAMTTTFAAKNNFLFRLLQSKIVVFEEAAEILESHVLACLTPYTQHVILIGDHMQLKPYGHTHQHNVSLFERLIKQQLPAAILKVQYRMRPCIAELICPTIYNELTNAEIVETYPAIRQMQKNVYFLTHQCNETKSKDESSLSNRFELQQIVSLAKYLIEPAEYAPEDIVILSPYAKQIDDFQLRLQQECAKMQRITAATVDSYQGLEANIVLLSLVRSNEAKQIGFLREKNRICVALSRAKHGLYIIGNLQLLSGCSRTWKAIEEKLCARDAIGASFPYEVDDVALSDIE